MAIPVSVDSMVWVEEDKLPPPFLTNIKEDFTFTCSVFDPTATRFTKKPSFTTKKVETFIRVEGWLGLPYDKGLKLFQNNKKFSVQKNLSDGFPAKYPKNPDPNHPNASPNQDQLIADALGEAKSKGSFMLQAPTGCGKTAVALSVIAGLSRTALIIVDSRNLARQWVDEIKSLLGLSDDDIGLMIGGKLDYEGKAVVVAVIHNLVATGKVWPEEFFSYFGCVVWDEAHILGSDQFALTMGLFNARVRVGLTATPERKDGCHELFFNYFGEPSVIGSSDALASLCLVYERQGIYRKGFGPKLISELTEDHSRNVEVADIVADLYLNDNRRVIVLSERIEQLQILMGLLIDDWNIPEADIGMMTRKWVTAEGKEIPVKDSELKHFMDHSKIILATYKMAAKAINIPTLDAGVEASPVSDVVQAIGRIRRPLPNKRTPVWVTIFDKGTNSLERKYYSRISELKKVNVEVANYE